MGIHVPEYEASDVKPTLSSMGELSERLDLLLAAAVSEGLEDEIRHLGIRRSRKTEHPICTDLRQLRVGYAYPFDSNQPSEIILSQAGEVYSLGPGDITQVVKRRLPLKVDKLLRAQTEEGAAESHLLIWLPAGTARSDAARSALHTAWDLGDPPPVTDLKALRDFLG
ncbi:hypothetical protein [Candidatus Poriferisodalis sp.]|uniref:hypothetical protein n=1 Tax=Candidatus Poriferisodalis sp. TaxID=3101277 RepID=UPI003B5A1BC1